MEWKELQTLVKRNIGYGIVQPGPSVPKGVPIIKVNNIISGLYDTKHLDKTTVDNDAKYQRTKLKGGELIVTVVGTCGKTAIVPIHFAGCNLVRATCLIDIEDETICRWIKYYIDSPYGQAYINRNLNTTVQATLNVKNLNEMPIPFYSDEYTLNVVKILSSLDRKIELNNKINADLEEMAQTIFKNWFVDFEPFKDGKFVDSELGMIPEGWKVGGLFDIAEIFDKKRKPLSGNVREKMDKIYPYYGATSCMDYVDDYIFDGIYTLIGEDGSVVKENGLPYMQYVWGKMWVNNHAHILQGKNGYSTEMIHALLSITNIKFLVTGAVQAKLSQGNMQKILVAIPPKNVLDEIRPVIDNLYSKIRINTDENSRLSLLRDTLLPRLMSGELEVPE